MATGADWMSAASFIGMAGGLYLQGFDGLAFIMGWTGGYCLVALFLAPYLRKFGQFTIPDFLAERYGGNIVRSIGVISAITCSFVYVVAQIYGVGIITSKSTVPGETRSPRQTSGVRFGTPALTTRGATEAQMRQVARAVARVVVDPEDTVRQDEIRAEMRAIADSLEQI